MMRAKGKLGECSAEEGASKTRDGNDWSGE